MQREKAATELCADPGAVVGERLLPAYAAAGRARAAVATMAAAVCATGRHARGGRRRTRVLSFITPPRLCLIVLAGAFGVRRSSRLRADGRCGGSRLRVARRAGSRSRWSGGEFDVVRTECEKTAKIAVASAWVGDTVPVCAIGNPIRPLVLVVEDEPEIAALMRDFLEADGFRVRLAADAEQAAGALGASPDCVLLDVMLPGRSGFDLCREIRAASEVPVLFLSARSSDAD